MRRPPFRIPAFLALLCPLLTGAVAAEVPKFSGATPVEWSQRLADSEIARRDDSLSYREGGKAHWDYTTGIFCLSLQKLSDAAHQPSYFAYAQNVIGSFIAPDGSIRTYAPAEYNLDNIVSGRPVLALYKKTKEERYRVAADTLRKQLETQPRTSEGGFWHKQRYPEQMWLDGVYMASPFLAHYSKVFDHPENFAEVTRQLLLADRHLYDANKGLHYHGWDESRKQSWANPQTGTSPNFWGRAIGWYAMALVDTLDVMPSDQPNRADVLEILKRVASGIARYQDPATGVWYQVVDQGDRAGNYREATASCMFVYALAKAANHSWLDPVWVRPIVTKAYSGILKEFVRQSASQRWDLTQCCSVAGLGYGRDGSFAYYIYEPVVSNDLKGIAPFILAGIELQKLLATNPTAQTGAAPADVAASGWDRMNVILSRIQPVTFPHREFSIADFGAKPDANATDAIRRAIEACHAAGGGHVRVPSGTYLTGAIHLLSNVDLHLDAGAVLKFSEKPEDYLPLVLTRFESIECWNYSPFVYALDQENIGITGEGTLDGSASDENWWSWTHRGTGRDHADARALGTMGEQRTPVESRRFGTGHYLRPVFIQPYRCRNVVIEGIHIRRSPMWEINPVLCRNVTVRNVDISTHGPNNDGCDPESSEDVLIEGCTFDTGDDCIAIKSGRNEDGRRIGVAAANIVIRKCVMKDGHGGVVIGSETSGGCHDVFAEDCTMDSPNLDRVLRIKSNAARGGVLENFFLRRIQVGRVAEAILTVDFQYEEGSHGDHIPTTRNVVLEDIESRSSPRVLYIAGFEGATIDRIRFSNCRFRGVESADLVEHAGSITFDHVTIESAKKVRSLNSRQL